MRNASAPVGHAAAQRWAAWRKPSESGLPKGTATEIYTLSLHDVLPISEGLRHAAQRCAAACPTGALALRTARSCDV